MASWNTSTLTWLITGASSGFGLALTRLALSHGHKVIATSRNPARNPDLVSEVEGQGSQWVKLDVDDPNCGSVIEDLEAQGTAIDVLVNNAGWSIHGPVESFPEDEVRRQMETVYFGPYRLMRTVLPHMRTRRRGLILNISSGASVNGRESMGVYAASKAAMDGEQFDPNRSISSPTNSPGLIRVLTKEVAPFNIRTLTVYLGGFDTNFTYALQVSKTPMPDDYQGTLTEKTVNSLQGSNFKPDGDHLKAAKVIYELAVGEGVGAGKEDESVVFLGRDMTRSLDDVLAKMNHQMETFREVADNVYREG